MRNLHGWHVALFLALAFAPGAAAAPQRVASTFLCTDEYVFRLLPRERIAALSYLAADRHPIVSTIADQVHGIPLVHNSAEEVMSLHPDAVVMFAGTESQLHTQLREAGIPIIDVGLSTSLAEIRRNTLALGRALGVEERAKALLNEMDRKLANAHATAPPVRTVIYEPNGYVTSDPVNDELLQRAGLSDFATEIGTTRSSMIPIESIVRRPPELLILSGSDSRPSLASLMMNHPALQSLSSRIMIARLSLRPLACPGPWSADVVPALSRLGKEARALAEARGEP